MKHETTNMHKVHFASASCSFTYLIVLHLKVWRIFFTAKKSSLYLSLFNFVSRHWNESNIFYWTIPGLFFIVYFRSFQTNITIFTKIYV